jgi:hypothetical protein
MPYVIDDGYILWVAESDGSATVTALDGTSDAFSPYFMESIASNSESLNVETVLLSGETAVTLVGGGDRAGTLSFVFTEDSAVSEAQQILKRATSFSLAVPDRPALNMTFVRSGTMGAAVHDTVKDVWEVTIGFLEVS